CVEVVNGGVEGYDSQNVLWRMGEFKGLRPGITLVELGWNDIYRDLDSGMMPLATLEFIAKTKRFLTRRFGDPQEIALEDYHRPKSSERDSPAVRKLDSYTPDRFVRQLEKIVHGLEAAGSRVVLLTLPGLFQMDIPPSPEALKMGHLPYFTDNPYFLAKLTERYNAAIRQTGKRLNLVVIDLATWSRTAFTPRYRYFTDSVHLTPKAQEKSGLFIAEQLRKRLPDQLKASRSTQAIK
ncbi:SGNH/GDSL hydrolase family protein, partial [Thermodesulfobacteriota bacterium]